MTDVDDPTRSLGVENPYLQGNFAPVSTERTVERPLEVVGAIPPALEGLLLRNGPNPAVISDPGRYHWFSGDGMIHAVELRDGAAVSYRNRWVRTRKLAEEIGSAAPHGPIEPINGPANTHVVEHGGRILALVESGLPHRISAGLETLCVEDFDGMLTSPMTAHPHVDPATGGMAFFGYDVFGPPFLRYHELDRSGSLIHSTAVEIPRATMQHDFGVTATRVAFLDLPVVFDIDLATSGALLPFSWKPEAGARIGILERGGDGADVRWVGFDPCFVFHVMNAFDDGAAVVLDACRYDSSFDTKEGQVIGTTLPTLERWRVDPAANRVSTTALDDRTVEFPRIDDAMVGRPYRFGYCAEVSRLTGSDQFVGLVRYDFVRDEAIGHEFSEHLFPGEPVFVRAPDGRSDDEGWVLSVVYDATTEMSDLYILDASSFTKAPDAIVHLPARVPYGFHGSWIPAERYR